MKKLILFFAVVFGVMMTGQAQDGAPQHKSVIKVNPLGLAFGNFNATYEGVLNGKSSIVGQANFRDQLFGVDVSIFGAGLGYRYYITNKNLPAPEGFYVQPQVSVLFGSVNDDDEVDANFTTFGVGAELGYQWVWDSGFVLDLGIGPMYTNISGDVDEVSFDETSGILPSATLAIGYAF